MIETILSALKTKIESMSVATGYMLDWGPCNVEDRADQIDDSDYDAHCVITWDIEENIDIDLGITNNFLNEFNITLSIRIPMTTETSNPNFDIQSQLDKGLYDIKRLFGRINCVGVSDICFSLYQGCTPNLNGIETGDRFLPYVYDVDFLIQYLQAKTLI